MEHLAEIVAEKIGELADQTKSPVLIAIDGRCGSGKTTLAEKLSGKMDMNLIHADHFFLQPHQRTSERLAVPGGNIDWERLSQVLEMVSQGEGFSYCPFDCHRQDFGETLTFLPKKLNIVEGSYSCHPQLWERYHLHIFLDVSEEEQIFRIRQRNGEEMLKMFQARWIPLEEKYFAEYKIQSRCEHSFSTETFALQLG